MGGSAANRQLFALGIDYAETRHGLLGKTCEDAAEIQALFARHGYAPADTGALARADARAIVDAIEAWAVHAPGRPEQLLVYLAGHGKLYQRRPYLLTPNSPAAEPYTSRSAVSFHDIAERLLACRAKTCAVLLDMCHAGFAANHLEALLRDDTEDRATPAIQLGVLASSLPLERSYDGLFAAALLAALAEGSPNNHWRDTTEQISLLELCSELRDRLGEQTAFTAGRDGIKIPNPRYRPGTAERPVLLGDLLASLPVEDREHFLDKASGSDARDIGWYFSGRRAATRQVLHWLHDHPEGGVCVVTGAPGAGKSAFLGRLAVLADPGSQNACRALGMLDDPAELLPTPGLFDAVVHARELDTARVAIEIGEQLGIDVAFANRPEVALRAALVESGRAVTVLIDAVDEVTRGNEDGVTLAIIRALASLPGCRVVVGTRRDRAGALRGAVEGDEGPLVEAMRPSVGAWLVLDLTNDIEAAADIATYVDVRLQASTRWPTAERRAAAARVVAQQADGMFLYARFALKAIEGQAEGLVSEPGWQAQLPTDVGAAGLRQVFANDLARYGAEAVRIRDLLRPLAFARGHGLPLRQVWPALATELAASDLGGSGRTYSERDAGYVVREASWYLMEASIEGEATFRLYHQAIADALREEALRAD